MESERQLVEYFHLAFLRVLATHPQRENCVLKGGCNLRFFFGSPRYSEDIDLDVRIASLATFKHAVERILDGPQLTKILAARGLKIAHRNGDKQTATTQRWKLGLQHGNAILPTKLDFSRRAAEGKHSVESVGAAILKQHQLPPPLLVHHYDGATAIRQKVAALADRSSVQARDVFDLNLLLAKVAKPPSLRDMKATAHKAARRALELSYREFAAMVLAYLPDDERE